MSVGPQSTVAHQYLAGAVAGAAVRAVQRAVAGQVRLCPLDINTSMALRMIVPARAVAAAGHSRGMAGSMLRGWIQAGRGGRLPHPFTSFWAACSHFQGRCCLGTLLQQLRSLFLHLDRPMLATLLTRVLMAQAGDPWAGLQAPLHMPAASQHQPQQSQRKCHL